LFTKVDFANDIKRDTLATGVISMIAKKEWMKQVKDIDFNEEAEILKVLAHPVRLQIAYGLSEFGNCNVKNIWTCLDLPQANVSQHLIVMKSKGILSSRREGAEMHYFLKNRLVEDLICCVAKKKKVGSAKPF
jgi:ArsR family transcriptional regulator